MNINIQEEKLTDICKKWGVTELALFGSVLRHDFSENSDIDILVSFNEKVNYGYFELAELQEELKDLLGRKIDLVSKRGLQASRNMLRKTEILSTAKVVYAA